jgi:hypothetical protein
VADSAGRPKAFRTSDGRAEDICSKAVLGFALYFLVTLISALAGLITGNLLLLGRDSPVIHGPAARILSALILLGGLFVAF